MNIKIFLALAALALSAASTSALVQDRAGEHSRRRPRASALARHPRLAEHVRERLSLRRDGACGRVLERLGVSDEQRERMRALAQSARPITERFRADARAIVERARENPNGGGRAATRAELKALFERYYPELEPTARALVGQLTPEQRAKLESRAKSRGRGLDEGRLERAAALRLLRHERREALRRR
jgi:hypothetical protein